MSSRTFYRDGVEEKITGQISVRVSTEGHTIEMYRLENGNVRYFVTIAGTHWCAHGDTVASAVADALWKDPKNRPSMEALVSEIQAVGKERKITLNEFRLLTGACLTGCREALKSVGKDESPLTAFEIRDHVSKDWGNKLLKILGWEKC